MGPHESNVLCAVADDEGAVSVVAGGRRLSEEGRYRVHYLHAADLPSRTLPAYVGTVPAPIPGYARELMVREALDRGRALLERLGIDVNSSTVEIVHGDPVDELQRKAEELEPDFVVLGSRGHGPLASVILGSVTRALATGGRWPLLVVGHADDGVARGPVICGVPAAAEEALSVADVAARFARRLGRTLVLAHSRDERSRPSLDAGGFPAAPGGVIPPAEPSSADDDPATILSDVVNALGGAATEFVVLEGAPASALAGLGDELDAEVIVVGSRGLGGLRNAIEGSVSVELIRKVDRPVMIVPASAATSSAS